MKGVGEEVVYRNARHKLIYILSYLEKGNNLVRMGVGQTRQSLNNHRVNRGTW